MKHILLPLALILLLVLAACGSDDRDSEPSAPIDDTPRAAACEPAPGAEIVTGWRFQTDPGDAGLDEGWHLPAFDDSGWRALEPGAAWENSDDADLAGYDGAGWYRTALTLPDWDAAYLVLSGIDDAGAAWANGEPLGEWELGDSRTAYVDLRTIAAPGETVTLVVRVLDRGVYGGLVDPVRLARTPLEGMTSAQRVAWWADQHPDWPMPGWTAGRPLAWTLTGGLDRADEALVSMDGAVAPWAGAPIVEAWLVDPATGEVFSGGGAAAFSLVNGDLPLPVWEWSGGGFTLRGTLFFDAADEAVRWRLEAVPGEGARDLKLVIAARPFAVNKSANAIHAASLLDPARLWLDGAPFMVAAQRPDSAGTGPLAEVMSAALGGTAPEANALDCAPDGDGAAALVYDLDGGEAAALHFAFPAAPGADFPPVEVDVTDRLDAAIDLWEAQTGRVRFELPDDRIMASVPASIGYLLLANDPDGPHPGSLAHDAVWVRDAAYTGLALLQAGHADTVRGYIPAIFDTQGPDGRVPPIQGESIPWDDDEWDSQGQAIFLTVAYYRYTGDRDLLQAYYPNIRRAAAFLVDLRAQTAGADPALRGLLPPSLSAEDLGPRGQHYYWDDFWAVAGLEEAAFAARTLGEDADADWMIAEADALRAAILDSVAAVMGEDAPYIPAAVEETASAAMARGTVPALWPYRVFAPDMPLLARSFDHYHAQWIAPFEGAYQHRQGQYWPYGGIELAHAYLRLGRGDVLHQILAWTLSNQTLPGTFAWAEQVSPANGGFTGGDMPHAWASGSYFTLIREMLLSENGAALDLFRLAPEWWFEGERVVAVTGAPTHFGALSLRAAGDLQNQDGAWRGTLTLTLGGAAPPDGFRWALPYLPAAVEGPDGTAVEDGVLIVPAAGTVTLTF